MTYTELVARLGAALGGDPSALDNDWPVYLPAVIEQAELRCVRDLDPLAARKTATVTIPANAGQFTAPTDWLLGQGIRLTASGATLDRRDVTFLNEYGGSGVPRYWAEPKQGTIQVAPVPATDTAAELSYHYRPAGLTSLNTATWLSLSLPDLLFYACMVSASGYIRNFGAQADDPRMAVSWEQQYQSALATARREEARRKGDNTFDTSAAPPPSSNQPAGVQ